MSLKISRNLLRQRRAASAPPMRMRAKRIRRERVGALRPAVVVLAVAAGLLMSLPVIGLTACSSSSSSGGHSSEPAFVQGGYSPAPPEPARPVGPAPVPERPAK